jgi:antiviral helicase SKI2
MISDIDPLAVSPRWSLRAEALAIHAPVYDYKQVPLTSIALVTNRTIKVDTRSIVDRHLIAPMNEAIAILSDMASEWTSIGNVPEVEWSKMRSLEFQETLRSRNHLIQKLSTVACTKCADFKDHVSTL